MFEIKYKQVTLAFESDTKNPWNVKANLSNRYELWCIYQVLDGGQGAKYGVEIGWKIVAVNEININSENYTTFLHILEDGHACTITFEIPYMVIFIISKELTLVL